MIAQFARVIAGITLIVGTLMSGIGVAANGTDGATVHSFFTHHLHCRPYSTDQSGHVTDLCFLTEGTFQEIDTPSSETIVAFHGTDCIQKVDAATFTILAEQCRPSQEQFVLKNGETQEFHYRMLVFPEPVDKVGGGSESGVKPSRNGRKRPFRVPRGALRVDLAP